MSKSLFHIVELVWMTNVFVQRRVFKTIADQSTSQVKFKVQLLHRSQWIKYILLNVLLAASHISLVIRKLSKGSLHLEVPQGRGFHWKHLFDYHR